MNNVDPLQEREIEEFKLKLYGHLVTRRNGACYDNHCNLHPDPIHKISDHVGVSK